ncbi:type II toxin-antitoxin system RelE/ParE family toxin [Mitsuokella sp.]|uniref:type II toxin-antitoxin system RelE/ParE family toxin n=1 Tax=Mitsuokella sp. TaxID=2049034 RepID=UPI003D7CC2F9
MRIVREFIHSKKFDEQWQALGLSDSHLNELQLLLLENPKCGAVMRGTGRLRKVRFEYGNRGKSHCARVCYVDFEAQDKIFLVMVFAKNKMENLSPSERNSIKKFIDELEHIIK